MKILEDFHFNSLVSFINTSCVGSCCLILGLVLQIIEIDLKTKRLPGLISIQNTSKMLCSCPYILKTDGPPC